MWNHIILNTVNIKSVLLGDQCFYYKTCAYIDQNADCVQVRHNAICQCKQGYHEVTLSRPQKRSFCSQDVLVVTTDTSTLLGVATGLAIFSALICFVLKLFVGDQPRHFANANLGPPILFASETGIPIAMTALRPSSRASSERSVGSYSRGSRGILVPASRAGAARAAAILLISCHLSPEQTQQESRVLSLASVHSSGSTRSYSMRRFEREKEQKLARQRTRELLTASARSTDQLLAEQALELAEWPSKSSDNALDTLEGGTSDTSFPPLSTSLPSDLASLPLSLPHSSEWPPKNL